jgi:membrane protein CcdC involved in cytochrome C biogenesis
MEDQAVKIQRSSNLIKVFMALVVIMQAAQFYQTNILDFGAIAGSIGVLSLLRGFLLSPSILVTPVKYWFKSEIVFSKESYKYFLLAFLLIIVSAV